MTKNSGQFFACVRELAISMLARARLCVPEPCPKMHAKRMALGKRPNRPFLAGLAEGCFKFRVDQQCGVGQATKWTVFASQMPSLRDHRKPYTPHVTKVMLELANQDRYNIILEN